MAGSWKSAKRQLLVQLDRDMRNIVDRNANMTAGIAKRLVPAPPPGQSRGYATGALREIIHVETETDYQGPYDDAVNRARFASDGRIVRRNQIQEAEPPEKQANQHTAQVSVPLEYAVLIERGFEHAGTGQYIIGTRYLMQAVLQVQDTWLQDLYDLLQDLENISLPTEEELIEKAQARETARARREYQQEVSDMDSAFRASTEPEAFQVSTGRVKGFVRERRYTPDKKHWYYTGSLIPVRSRETQGERLERIALLKQQWRDAWTEFK